MTQIVVGVTPDVAIALEELKSMNVDEDIALMQIMRLIGADIIVLEDEEAPEEEPIGEDEIIPVEELVEEESEDILMKEPPEEVVAEIKISNQPASENIPEN